MLSFIGESLALGWDMARGIAGLLSLALLFGAGVGASAQHVLEGSGAVELTDAERTADALVAAMVAPWTGDLDGMVARGFVRMGVPHEPISFVYDGPEQRGLAVEFGREFEAHLRATLGAGAETLTVALLPLTRDAMIDALVSGRVDVLAANLTVTPSRADRVDFADPMLRGVRELVVTGPAAPPVATLDDLAAVPVHVRPSSSYYEHLMALCDAGRRRGAAAEEALEDNDLAELVDVRVFPAVILDSHEAEL
jgi:ABC-type amino acid transport substrate-binding protein